MGYKEMKYIYIYILYIYIFAPNTYTQENSNNNARLPLISGYKQEESQYYTVNRKILGIQHSFLRYLLRTYYFRAEHKAYAYRDPKHTKHNYMNHDSKMIEKKGLISISVCYLLLSQHSSRYQSGGRTVFLSRATCLLTVAPIA